MKIAIGADHGGFPLNERVIEELRAVVATVLCLSAELVERLSSGMLKIGGVK